MTDAPTAPTPTKAKRTRYRIAAEDFVVVWEQSATAEEAAKRLGTILGRDVPREIVQARAIRYRNAGVRLKHMPRANDRGLKAEALNAKLAGLAGEAAAPSTAA